MFDTDSMDLEYVNIERPANVPLNPAGKSYPVIARFVLPDRSEIWLPAVAVRWTDTHVFVGTQHADDEKTYSWLQADDVTRAIRRPPPSEDESLVESAI